MSNVVCTLICSITLLLILVPVETWSLREIPDNNLAYPVQVNSTNCTTGQNHFGSGFFLNTGKSLYLVTARHIIFGNIKGVFNPNTPLLCKEGTLLSYSKDPKEKQQNIIDLNFEVLNKNDHIKSHKTHDVSVIYLGTTSKLEDKVKINFIDDLTIKKWAPAGILMSRVEWMKKFEDIFEANDIYVFGYPSSIGLKNQPQIDYQKPLIRQGIIAGINDINKTIILDCFIFPGNSGGPVVQAEWERFGERSFSIIGVISEFVPITETWLNENFKYRNTQVYNSGYSVAVPIDMVLELIN